MMAILLVKLIFIIAQNGLSTEIDTRNMNESCTEMRIDYVTRGLHLTGDEVQEPGMLSNESQRTILARPGQQIIISDNRNAVDYLMPGIPAPLNVVIKDCHNVSVKDILRIMVTTENSVKVSDFHTILFDSSSLALSGEINTTTTVSISLLNRPNSEIIFDVTLKDCPPGYVWELSDNSTNYGRCRCTALTEDRYYMAIYSCDPLNFSAILKPTHWAGHVGNNFRTGFCPKGFCINDTDYVATKIYLPNTSSFGYDLSSYVCRTNRSGVLCGSCIENNSVYYHTRDYDCRYNKRCHIGWLFFILSQLVPVTILFVVITVFNISLTDGYINILVFYFQVIDTFHIGGNGLIKFDTKTHTLLQVIRLIARIFQLDFFCLQIFSFCLWEGATTLSIIAINYVTTVYALGLVILTVLIIVPCLHKLKVKHVISVKSKISKTIIHGLTGFLVLCYFQSTKTSLLILNSTQLAGEQRKLDKDQRVYYNGNLTFFGRGHYYYATLALLFLVSISSIPPLLLLCYPLCYKVLAACKLQESKFSRILCKVIPLEKYRPLFDSFQSTYKDKHRYFAALFFIYRLIFLMTFAFVRGLSMLYFFLQVEILIILFFHAWIHPHKNKWHNCLDVLIFTLLAVLNGMTVFNYLSILDKHSKYLSGIFLSTLQVMISGTPILMLLGYISYHAIFVHQFGLNKLRKFFIRDIIRMIPMTTMKRGEEAVADDLSICERDSRDDDSYDNTLNSTYSKCD